MLDRVNLHRADHLPEPGAMHSAKRLSILFVSQMPASPPRFGAQARMHGLMTQLAQRHDLTAVALVDDEFDIEECRLAMQAYCRDVILIRILTVATASQSGRCNCARWRRAAVSNAFA